MRLILPEPGGQFQRPLDSASSCDPSVLTGFTLYLVPFSGNTIETEKRRGCIQSVKEMWACAAHDALVQSRWSHVQVRAGLRMLITGFFFWWTACSLAYRWAFASIEYVVWLRHSRSIGFMTTQLHGIVLPIGQYSYGALIHAIMASGRYPHLRWDTGLQARDATPAGVTWGVQRSCAV